MINARELRIGNYVLYKESMAEVSEIGLKHIYAFTFYREAKTPTGTENVSLSIEDLKPIPLNEELLLKCGLKPHYFGIKTYYHPLIELDHDFKLMGIDYNVQIKYLHQLQNIYFDLTGQELEVTL